MAPEPRQARDLQNQRLVLLYDTIVALNSKAVKEGNLERVEPQWILKSEPTPSIIDNYSFLLLCLW